MDVADGSCTGLRRRRREVAASRRPAAPMCSGVVPQQPPMTCTPSSVTKRRVVLGQLLGREVVVHLAVDHRRQAGVGQARDRHARRAGDRWRRCSLISDGPVAQLRPMTSGCSGSTAASAAPISVPGSMRPVSSIVTWPWIGTSRPAAAMARRQPITAAFRPSRSNWVSMRSRSTPPSSSPRACTS